MSEEQKEEQAPNQGFQLKVPIEELRKKKLFIATPMYGKSASL